MSKEYNLRKFTKIQNRQFSIMVNSGSSANLLLIQLLNLGRIKKGQKIAVSALTKPTNIMPIMQLGLTPVLVDCEINTLNVSLKVNLRRFAKTSI